MFKEAPGAGSGRASATNKRAGTRIPARLALCDVFLRGNYPTRLTVSQSEETKSTRLASARSLPGPQKILSLPPSRLASLPFTLAPSTKSLPEPP